MDSATMDNANPTILSASQLPTRQKKLQGKAAAGFETVCSDMLFGKLTASSPWSTIDGSDASSDASADAFSFRGLASRSIYDDDENPSLWTREPIDEQEIYGESTLSTWKRNTPS
jgi:hypothetical protein